MSGFLFFNLGCIFSFFIGKVNPLCASLWLKFVNALAKAAISLRSVYFISVDYASQSIGIVRSINHSL